jgi:hypothetical protein
MEMAHSQQISQVSAMLQNATREMEESDFQKRATMDRLASVERRADQMLDQAEYHMQMKTASLADARQSAEEWERRVYAQRREFEEHDFRVANRHKQMEQHLLQEGEALAGSNRIISERNEDLRQEVMTARRLRQTTEELQVSLREVIATRDQYGQELNEGLGLDAALRQQLEALRVRLQASEKGQMRTARARNQHRAESDGYAAQLRDTRQLLVNSGKTASILDRTSKIQA